ncbi:peptidase S8/S53 domain-containing protein [Emericellopsis atlantica]|uniref:Peptidase S8/S53 domain-containing protein n=1 Tax=Emericellopsis atlantica TaxID=2614577 RepID=A0A9P7ZLB1_9HYPO|nr:peptidase S8/S53 domain-containing protein [Emericellopsis atlantica]KAG9254213.1 peptidase S8/S53 domain-containing protein [Emericellopsis atlantica]
MFPCNFLALCIFLLTAPPRFVLGQTFNEGGAWVRQPDPSTDTNITITIALANPKREEAVNELLAVSDPGSPKYGIHWRNKDVQEKFSPSKDTVRNVLRQISASGLSMYKAGYRSGLIHLTCPAWQVQDVFRTSLLHYRHRSTGATTYRFQDSYHIPPELEQDVLWVAPVFDHPEASRSTQHPSSHQVRGEQDCVSNVTPSCLREIYKIPQDNYTHPDNSIGFFSPGWSSWISSDLDEHFAAHAPELLGHMPSVVPINDGYRQTDVQSDPFNLEPNMDAELLMTLAYPQNVTNFQVGDSTHPGNVNTLLAAFDDTYCDQLDGVLDPIVDVKDVDCGTIQPPNVLSISYAWAETDFPPEYLAHQCHEFLKLGLQGVTVIVSTGDMGTGRHPDGECGDKTSKPQFVPSWPASCPWVTAVGGTKFVATEDEGTVTSWRNLPSTGLPHERDTDEVAYFRPNDDGNRSSAGGMSNAFATPEYQAQHVSRYLEQQSDHLDSFRGQFNQSGRTYPDVSAAASFIQVFTGGRFHSVSGTSSSAPIFAAIVTKINNERLRSGKGPVGFINPTLYANKHVFHDVTEGYNTGCGVDEAFRSAEGWDPVTGLGSPDYEALLDLFMSI